MHVCVGDILRSSDPNFFHQDVSTLTLFNFLLYDHVLDLPSIIYFL
jgi:hypothetical protein